MVFPGGRLWPAPGRDHRRAGVGGTGLQRGRCGQHRRARRRERPATTWHSGQQISHHGMRYEVQDGQIYTCPEQPVPIYVSGFGPQAAGFAGRLGDGCCTAMPADLVKAFRTAGGGDKPVQAVTKVGWDRDRDPRLMLRTGVGPTRAARSVRADACPAKGLRRCHDAGDPRCGGRVDRMRPESRRPLSPGTGLFDADADADEVYVQQTGPDMDGFFASWEREVLPPLRQG